MLLEKAKKRLLEIFPEDGHSFVWGVPFPRGEMTVEIEGAPMRVILGGNRLHMGVSAAAVAIIPPEGFLLFRERWGRNIFVLRENSPEAKDIAAAIANWDTTCKMKSSVGFPPVVEAKVASYSSPRWFYCGQWLAEQLEAMRGMRVPSWARKRLMLPCLA